MIIAALNGVSRVSIYQNNYYCEVARHILKKYSKRLTSDMGQLDMI